MTDLISEASSFPGLKPGEQQLLKVIVFTIVCSEKLQYEQDEWKKF
jgi:hypothetical protein